MVKMTKFPECDYCEYFQDNVCISSDECKRALFSSYPNGFQLDEHLMTIDKACQPVSIINDDSKVVDVINKPAHYNREGAMQCIEEMLVLFGTQAVMDFCRCNAWKYRYRAADKNGQEDLAKSDVYMKWYKQLKETGTLTLD